MEEHIYPNERALSAEDDAADALIAELRGHAKDAGLWAPHLPPEAGGTGSGFIEYAYLNEEIGRSAIAQLILGCQAPDAGNGEILHMYGTPEQRERFLEPLVAGETRSFFGMTEPEVAGSDPTLLRGRAVRDGDDWVIDAHKWFSSGADGAGFGVVMVVTDPDAEPHKRASMILVPTDTPGYELVRKIPVMGHLGHGWATHCETLFTDVPRPGREHARRAGRRLPDRAEAPRPGPDPPRDALARPDAARVRADVLLRARAQGVRRSARRQADGAELDRRVGGGDPGVPADDAAGGAPARRGRRGARRGVADQVLRGARAQRRDRPRDPGARRPRRHRRHAARRDVPHGARARASTTAPTRCTRWSSHAGSSARSRTGASGASRSSRGRARPARAARAAARGAALGGSAGRAGLPLVSARREREPRRVPRLVRVGARALASVRAGRRRRSARLDLVHERARARPRARDRQHVAVAGRVEHRRERGGEVPAAGARVRARGLPPRRVQDGREERTRARRAGRAAVAVRRRVPQAHGRARRTSGATPRGTR